MRPYTISPASIALDQLGRPIGPDPRLRHGIGPWDTVPRVLRENTAKPLFCNDFLEPRRLYHRRTHAPVYATHCSMMIITRTVVRRVCISTSLPGLDVATSSGARSAPVPDSGMAPSWCQNHAYGTIGELPKSDVQTTSYGTQAQDGVPFLLSCLIRLLNAARAPSPQRFP